MSGPTYKNRDWVQQAFDPRLVEAMDSIAQGTISVGQHIAATPNVVTNPPTAPSSLNVTFGNGVFTVMLSDKVNSQPGIHYMVDYSTDPQFSSFHTLDLGTSQSYQQNWGQQTLFFRSWAKYTSSGASGFTYFGTSANPTAVVGS